MPDPSFSYSTRLARDHYVRFDVNDYSVNPRFVGRMVRLRADLDHVVVVSAGEIEVARHRRRLAKPPEPLGPEPRHDASHDARPRRFAVPTLETEVEARDLSEYDKALGVA